MPTRRGMESSIIQGDVTACNTCENQDEGFCTDKKKWCYLTHCKKKGKKTYDHGKFYANER
jgi:hypothetical protein